jgi:hypothetical protein
LAVSSKKTLPQDGAWQTPSRLMPFLLMYTANPIAALAAYRSGIEPLSVKCTCQR